ncbi:MAG: glycosyltransferase [Chloroflexota bacterium]
MVAKEGAMKPTSITADNSVFVLLSFEGPDLYSMAGGLGVRVTNLSWLLAEMGFPTHLFFVGDPKLKGEEVLQDGKLTLHRWCQWLSRYYPKGVYQGEKDKYADFSRSIPPYVIEQVIKPAVQGNRMVIILGEEWQTSEAMWRLGDQLHKMGLRDRAVLFWNANNTFGFDQIDWERLTSTTTITTVSRYMRQIMQGRRLNPLVIPNGIPRSSLEPVDELASARLRSVFRADFLLTKVGRWDPAKRWDMAFAAVARLKTKEFKTVLLALGGMEAYGGEMWQYAHSLGLTIQEVKIRGNPLPGYLQALRAADEADILSLRFYCPPELLRLLYHASDAVLANSSHEPFGLVGLEAMAAGGVAFTGGTGEDYAIALHNAIVLDTTDPREIEDYLLYLKTHPSEAERILRNARETASFFTWQEVLKNLLHKLEYQARNQGLLATRTVPVPEPRLPEHPEPALPDTVAVAVVE